MSYKPPYTISEKSLNLVIEITNLIAKVDANRKSDVQLRKKNRIKTIVGTLAIEGNTLEVKQVTALLEGQRVMGSPKEIQEVKSALDAYEQMEHLNPYVLDDLLKAHGVMMNVLVPDAGHFRTVKVAVKGDDVIHVAPPPSQVPTLMDQLFGWLKGSTINPLISSAVFHYEFEFIHPFSDGNGRMGRFWQTLILSHYHPSFAFFPIESIIKERQETYYKTLSVCDAEGDSTRFIEFILECILEAVSSVISSEKSSENTDEAILRYLSKYPKATIQTLADELDLSTRAIEKQLSNLKKEGRLQRIGSARKGSWVVM
ncbi:Fic family protein [Sulfuricurvum sp.]|uniref:Fic family protein n=1 Tax=Sulfuricurvum sp. TaxID=2025608 RepID=UPI002D337F08|nr:Fic family protein [Sulfuricurvum sp.]HZF71080.1 Fic family protein [Sulfuricurvum sp.]